MRKLNSDDISRIINGDVLFDDWSRDIYSVDASNFVLKPELIVCPYDRYDVENLCKYCFDKNISLTPRGAGTGLLGQSLSNNIVVDFTKYMNKILEIESDYVLVEPGVVKGVLDKELKKRGKFLPPDPASGNYCTIGGMIANNSSGAHSLGYGSTIDFLQEVGIVYSNGTFSKINEESYSFDPLMITLFKLLSPYLDIIQNQFPKVTKNSCGYRLDALFSNKKFSPQKIFASSEGTLGLVTHSKLKIVDIPQCRHLFLMSFKDMFSAILQVPLILQFSPTAVELLDHTVISNINENTINDPLENFGCLLFVEFAGDKAESIDKKVRIFKEKLCDKCNILESVSDDKSITQIWASRKGALNNVMKISDGSRKPIGLIEDTVVANESLYDYVRFMIQSFADNDLKYVIYGHAGDGNLHVRPIIDTNSASQIRLMDSLANQIFAKVIKLGGTITGEHGDGLARVKYIPFMYGEKLYSVFGHVKNLFDPKSILNPGKKLLT